MMQIDGEMLIRERLARLETGASHMARQISDQALHLHSTSIRVQENEKQIRDLLTLEGRMETDISRQGEVQKVHEQHVASLAVVVAATKYIVAIVTIILVLSGKLNLSQLSEIGKLLGFGN